MTRWLEKRSHAPRGRSAHEITCGVCPELLLLQSLEVMRSNSSQIGLTRRGFHITTDFCFSRNVFHAHNWQRHPANSIPVKYVSRMQTLPCIVRGMAGMQNCYRGLKSTFRKHHETKLKIINGGTCCDLLGYDTVYSGIYQNTWYCHVTDYRRDLDW
jgi:hypothetical protein